MTEVVLPMNFSKNREEVGVVRANAVVKIKNLDTLYTVIVEEHLTVEWNMNSAGICKFNLVKQPNLNISEGNAVMVYFRTNRDTEDDDKPFFLGYIFTISRDDDEIISITAYDQLRYLKYKDTMQFKESTLSERVEKICESRGLPTGDIDDTGSVLSDVVYEDKEYFDMFQESQDENMRNTEEIYVLFDKSGHINLKSLSNMKIEDYNWGRFNTEAFNLESSIDEGVYNIVKIDRCDDQGQVMDSVIATDDEKVAKWGMLQFYAKDNTNRDIEAIAKAALSLVNKKTRKLRLNNCIGDTRVRAGSVLGIVMPGMGDIDVEAYMVVTNVAHKIGNGTHLMALDLTNDDFMDNPDIAGMFENKNKSAEGASGGGGMLGNGLVPGDSNEARIWNFFRSRGFTAEATAAILGNFFQESHLDPGVHQYGGGPGRGLAQWEASYSGGSGRWDKLVAWANSKGLDPYALETQCEWVLVELEDPYFKQFLANFKNMTDVNQATIHFSKYYEGAGIPNDANRLAKANDFYTRLKALEQSGYGTGLGLSDTPSTRQSIVNYAKSMLGKGIWYSQTSRPGDPSVRNENGAHDCSSFVRHVYKAVTGADIGGYTLPQYEGATPISRDQLQPGDIMFNGYQAGNSGHVMIYIGDGQYIHCTSGGGREAIRIDNVASAQITHTVRWLK